MASNHVKLPCFSTNCKCSSVNLEHNADLSNLTVKKKTVYIHVFPNMIRICKDKGNNFGNLLTWKVLVEIWNSDLWIFLLQYGILLKSTINSIWNSPETVSTFLVSGVAKSINCFSVKMSWKHRSNSVYRYKIIAVYFFQVL